jgi:hypothetical protein
MAAVLSLRLVPAGWSKIQRAREALDARRLRLAHAMADVRQLTALEDSAARLETRVLGLAPRILVGGSQSEAVADLTTRLGQAAREHHVHLARTDVVADSARAGGLRRVSVRLAIEGDSRGTLETLEGLSRGSVVLVPADLRIAAPNPTSSSSVPETLQSEITIQAWYLAREVSQ